MFLLILLSISIAAIDTAAPTPRCPSNMVQPQENSTICYLLVETPNTFQKAESFCNQKYGNLVPIFDQFTNFFIAVQVHPKFNNSVDYWIGGSLYTDINVSGIWTWTWHNALMTFNDWQMNQPNSNYRCVASNTNTALWSAEDCKAEKPFVCQIPAVVDVCDPEWSYFKAPNATGMCYRYIAQANITFLQAQNVCLNQQANLVSIHSQEESDFLKRMAEDKTIEAWYNEGVFIGLQYQNLNWKWLDGSNFNYENWGPDQPITPINRTCAYMYPDEPSDWIEKWENYLPSTTLNRFICEKSPNLVFVT